MPANKRQIWLGADEFPRTKQPVFFQLGLKFYTFFPPFIAREDFQEQNGFDCYIEGNLRTGDKIELLASFQRVTKGRYKKLKFYILQGCNNGECTMVLNFFLLKYARRQRFTFLDCGILKELS